APPATSQATSQALTFTDLEKFCGVYELAPGKLTYIEHWPGTGEGSGQGPSGTLSNGRLSPSLLLTDDQGTVRALYHDSQNRFTAGRGMELRTPTQQALVFIPDSKGRIARMTYQQTGAPPRAGRKLTSYQRELIHFQSGAERLAGTLLTPPGKGPHPALVLVH